MAATDDDHKAHHADEIECIETIDVDGRVKASIQIAPVDTSVVVVSPSENRRVLRKIDFAILPIILVIYALQSLDKTALSYASVFGLIDDLHLRGQQYSWAGAIVYVAQLIWQPVIAYLLVKLPLGKFCAVMVFCWGATLCGTVAARNFGGLMASRFLLGSFEASVAPIFIALVQMWYRRSEQTNRNAAWYSMLGVVNIFGSLLTFGLAHIQSNTLRPFQIIFLFCGCLTVVFAFVVWAFLPDSPDQASFLSSDEKRLAIERVRLNKMGMGSGVWRQSQVKESLLDPKTWLWFALIVSISIPSGGISTFGPLIVKSFGFDSFKTILFNMPFGAVQLTATLASAFAATHWKAKSPILAALCIPPIVGIAILLSIAHTASNRGVLLFAYYLTSVYPAISPLIYSWSSQNTAGDTKRKVTTAVLFIGQSAGNIVGPNLYTTAEAPQYRRGLRSNLSLFVVIIILAGVGAAWIFVLNRRHAETRQLKGKAAEVLDASMQKNHSLNVAVEVVDAVNGTDQRSETSDDVTDLKNEDFIFVY